MVLFQDSDSLPVAFRFVSELHDLSHVETYIMVDDPNHQVWACQGKRVGGGSDIMVSGYAPELPAQTGTNPSHVRTMGSVPLAKPKNSFTSGFLSSSSRGKAARHIALPDF